MQNPATLPETLTREEFHVCGAASLLTSSCFGGGRAVVCMYDYEGREVGGGAVG